MYGGSPVQVFPPRGFSPEPPFQKSGMSRPSGKAIYMQRKEYAESMSRQSDNFQYRVEHLFTSELDGRELSTTEDCVTRLKSLDSKGKIWGQDMIMDLQGNYLQLRDIETKEVLESVHLNSIKKTNAVLDSCVYDSLLIIVVQDHGRRTPQAFLFQCEESGAQDVLKDLNRAIQQGGGDDTPSYKEQPMDIRSNLENIIGQGLLGSIKRPPVSPKSSTPPPPEYPPPLFNSYKDYEDGEDAFMPRDDSLYGSQYEGELTPPPYPDMERNAEIFNHVAADIEIFINKTAVDLPKNEGSKKRKKEKNAKKQVGNLPPVEEYVSCLQKIKYGFNLLGKLEDYLKNPPASDFVHSLFSSLGFMVSYYPPNIPSTVLSPMLTEKALHLLGTVATSEENRLWGSLGDSWNVPRSKWPNGDQITPYYPVFYDGWQAPPPVTSPPSQQMNSEQFPPRNVTQRHPDQDNRPWNAPPIRSSEPPLQMRVIYDFMARNNRELSVMKGEVVQVIDKSKQWWKVKKSRGEEGHVPPNVLEPVDREMPTANHGRPGQNMRGPPSLDMKSRPEEVRAWLQYKGFSKGTVQSLGVFNGAMLLGMKQDEIRAICPEEGGRVFFQLQSVRATIALASETGHPYGTR